MTRDHKDILETIKLRNAEYGMIKLKRRIVDYIHKYATNEQLTAIAVLLGIRRD